MAMSSIEFHKATKDVIFVRTMQNTMQAYCCKLPSYYGKSVIFQVVQILADIIGNVFIY